MIPPQVPFQIHNAQAQDANITGFFEKVDTNLIKLIQEDQLHPKPLMLCSGGTSSRCSANGHWTLDLRRNYKTINFNALEKDVVIQAGVNMNELLSHLVKENRIFPVGLSGITGIGYILTGGISPLSRKYGLAIDQILEIEGVWGNGNKFRKFKPGLLTLEQDINEWRGLCGAAPFLGIITKLRLKTNLLKPLYLWESSLSPVQLSKTIQIAESWPDYASLHWIWGDYIKAFAIVEIDSLGKMKDVEGILNQLPKTIDSKLFRISSLNKLKEMKVPVIENKESNKRYSEVLGLLGSPLLSRSYEFVKSIEEIMNLRPNKQCYLAAQQLGGNTMRASEGSTSFVHRDAMWKPWITGSWDPKSNDEKDKSLTWMVEAWSKIEPYCPGVHLAQLHDHLPWHTKEVNAAFKEWLPGLQQLKSTCDPKGILPPL
ncbi:FAD-binding protein [Prochlorococcus marinus]|uniref:FAD linked oxidase, N-terminal n=1 Tax=Prochlorococcus marinus (strain MIT 9211) TaxID=93059 RepID=A9BA25_PROM4|nr:FAD-binding protein [Prochlorococcus marinus]ABX08687.1 FAD linked oxidase, N-terminal [Prochlorococcus marinus str. MIT 9211]